MAELKVKEQKKAKNVRESEREREKAKHGKKTTKAEKRKHSETVHTPAHFSGFPGTRRHSSRIVNI